MAVVFLERSLLARLRMPRRVSRSPDTHEREHPFSHQRVMFTLIHRHRQAMGRLLGATSVLLPAAVAVYAVVWHAGDWSAQRFFIGYTAPLLALGPAWLRRRLAGVGERPQAADRVDVLAFAAGAVRSGGGWGVLPYSGHTLFLTYVLLTGPGRGFRVVAAMLLATTTWFKLALWNDPYSWALGIAIGAVLVAVRRYAVARERRAQDDRVKSPVARSEGHPHRSGLASRTGT